MTTKETVNKGKIIQIVGRNFINLKEPQMGKNTEYREKKGGKRPEAPIAVLCLGIICLTLRDASAS